MIQKSNSNLTKGHPPGIESKFKKNGSKEVEGAGK